MLFSSGLGYIIGTEVAKLFDNRWQWGLRVSVVTVMMIHTFDPPCTINMISRADYVCTSFQPWAGC